MRICFCNNQGNFQLHRSTINENIAKFNVATFFTHTAGDDSFWPVLHFCSPSGPLPSIHDSRAKFEVCRPTLPSPVSEISVSQNLKSMSSDLGHAPFWPLFTALHWMQSVLLVRKKLSVCLLNAWIVAKRKQNRSRIIDLTKDHFLRKRMVGRRRPLLHEI